MTVFESVLGSSTPIPIRRIDDQLLRVWKRIVRVLPVGIFGEGVGRKAGEEGWRVGGGGGSGVGGGLLCITGCQEQHHRKF